MTNVSQISWESITKKSLYGLMFTVTTLYVQSILMNLSLLCEHLNATEYNDIPQKCVLLILQQFGNGPFLFQHVNGPVHQARFRKK